jgi:hypothetical protein
MFSPGRLCASTVNPSSPATSAPHAVSRGLCAAPHAVPGGLCAAPGAAPCGVCAAPDALPDRQCGILVTNPQQCHRRAWRPPSRLLCQVAGRWLPAPSGCACHTRLHVRRRFQPRQKSLNRSADSSVYLTVCWMFRCPRYACSDRVSCPWLASAKPQACRSSMWGWAGKPRPGRPSVRGMIGAAGQRLGRLIGSLSCHLARQPRRRPPRPLSTLPRIR